MLTAAILQDEIDRCFPSAAQLAAGGVGSWHTERESTQPEEDR